jgi:hypothetical protein
MQNPPTNPVDALERAMRQRFPGAGLDVERFASGAAMIDMRLGPRFFVVAFSPRHGTFGIDEVCEGEDEGLSTHYRHGADSVDGVIARLTELVGREPLAVSA